MVLDKEGHVKFPEELANIEVLPRAITFLLHF